MRAVFLCLLLCLTFVSQAWAQNTGSTLDGEKRVALVVGNADYPLGYDLRNPGNDASDLAEALENLGFQVILGLDLAEAEMRARLEEFKIAIQDSDVALFFFAGHGFQANSQNYLLSVDIEGGTAEAVLPKTVNLNDVLEVMETAPGTKLVFIDACRDNPLEITEEPQGLAQAGTNAGFLIAFSTQPNSVAYDGSGRNSFFTNALLHHLPIPGQTISELMIAVRNEVYSITGRQQVPWDQSSLTRQFVFKPGERVVSEKAALFQIASALNSVELAQFYVDRFPGGAHVEDARLIATGDLGGAGLTRGEVNLDEIEGELWGVVRRIRSRRLLDLYLSEFEDGRHALAARSLRSFLPDDAARAPDWTCRQLATHPNDASRAFPGVPSRILADQAGSAIEACSQAVANAPEDVVLVSLLARSFFAAGDQERAIELFRAAARRGDPRALFSLGRLAQVGVLQGGAGEDAITLYRRAINAGSADAMINVGNQLIRSAASEAQRDEGIALLELAAGLGSARARFNLGVLALDAVRGTPGEALGILQEAARAGDPEAHTALANIYDNGWPIPPDIAREKPDPEAAADRILLAVVEDNGTVLTKFRDRDVPFSRATLSALQRKLADAGFYTAGIDGRNGPALIAALDRWRRGGFDRALLDTI